jgi:hypothetical protein
VVYYLHDTPPWVVTYANWHNRSLSLGWFRWLLLTQLWYASALTRLSEKYKDLAPRIRRFRFIYEQLLLQCVAGCEAYFLGNRITIWVERAEPDSPTCLYQLRYTS